MSSPRETSYRRKGGSGGVYFGGSTGRIGKKNGETWGRKKKDTMGEEEKKLDLLLGRENWTHFGEGGGGRLRDV